MDNGTLLLALLPFLLISLGLTIFALIDLIRRDSREVQGGNKWLWLIVILFVSTLGPIVYLAVGRTQAQGGRY